MLASRSIVSASRPIAQPLKGGARIFPWSTVGLTHPVRKKEIRCPSCGNLELHRSRRRWYERLFNWLFWFHKRPYRCANCQKRFWIRLSPYAWRCTMLLHFRRGIHPWPWYVSALLMSLLVAWVVSAFSQL